MRRVLVVVLLAASLASSLAGCRTGDRLWRVTPFEGSAGSDRVNVWPLAYRDGDELSVLWPLFDVDDQGFALRPLVARDGTAWSILFPLSSFDTSGGVGWFVPFYWWDDNAGLFPLAHLGGLSWVGPVWWTERSSGVFPVAQLGETSWIGPVWWTGGEDAAGGLFPVATFAGLSWVGPVWWMRESGAHGVFPLYGRNLLGGGVQHVGPFWWRSQPSGEGAGEDDDGGFEGGLWPLVWYGDGGDSLGVLPLYSHRLGERSSSRYALLGLGHAYSSETRSERWLLPLYYERAEAARADSVLLPLYWKRVRGERADVYTLLGNRRVSPEGGAFNVYPLWWSSQEEDSGWSMLLPFFWYGHEGDERTLLTPLGGRGWSTSGEEAFVNVLGPLYHHSESLRRDEERTAFLWPLFERHRRGDERTTRVLGLWERTRDPASTETTLALGLGHALRTETGSSHRLWPLYSWSDDEELPGPLYGLTLYGRHRRGEAVEERLFPLWWRSDGAGTESWAALLGLVRRERGADGRGHDWVWPLWSRSNGARPGIMELSSLWSTSRWEGGEDFRLGGGLVHAAWREEDAFVRRENSRTLLLLSRTEEERTAPLVPTAGGTVARNRVRREARGFLFEAFLSEAETYRVWDEGLLDDDEQRALGAYAVRGATGGDPERERVRGILAARDAAPPDDGDDDAGALREAVQAFADEHTHTRERRRVRLPFLWNHLRTDDELEWSGPLGLVSYERDPGRSRFRLLYYAYRSETEGGRTSRDVFPFITWDTGPGEARFSFLWRVLRYERDGDRRGGHVLFVPWGDA